MFRRSPFLSPDLPETRREDVDDDKDDPDSRRPQRVIDQKIAHDVRRFAQAYWSCLTYRLSPFSFQGELSESEDEDGRRDNQSFQVGLGPLQSQSILS